MKIEKKVSFKLNLVGLEADISAIMLMTASDPDP